MPVHSNTPSAAQQVQKPGEGPKPAVSRILANVGGTTTTAASEAAKKSVYDAGNERTSSPADMFTTKTDESYAQELADKAKKQAETQKAARLLENGKLFAETVSNKDGLLLKLLDQALPQDLKQAIKDRTQGENDPQMVFNKAQSNPVGIPKLLAKIVSPQLADMLKEAQEEGDKDKADHLEQVIANLKPLFDIVDMEELGGPQHMALLGHVSELSEKGLLNREVGNAVEELENSYQKFAESENRISGVLDKINKSVLAVADVGVKGDKQVRNLVARLTGAAMSDYMTNGHVFSFNDDEVPTRALPYESQFNIAVRWLLPKEIATALNRTFIGQLTEAKPYPEAVLTA